MISNRIDKKFYFSIKQGKNKNLRAVYFWCEEEALITEVEYAIWKDRFDHVFKPHEIYYNRPGPRVLFHINGFQFKRKDKAQYKCETYTVATKGELTCDAQIQPCVFRDEARYAEEGAHKRPDGSQVVKFQKKKRGYFTD